MEPQAASQDAPVEGWIIQSQNTLGRRIEKPRLMADRLRKPPFRFLFDIAAEVARQTGFGLVELFGGELADKPAAPGTRDEKVAFLEKWIMAVATVLGPAVQGDLANVSAHHIICGLHPEWTNYLLQCTSAAAWPELMTPAPEAADAASVQAAAVADGGTAEPAPLPSPDLIAELAAAAAVPQVEPIKESELLAAPVALPEQVNFSETFNQFAALDDEFNRTAQQWQTFQAAYEAKSTTAADDADADDDDDIDTGGLQLTAQEHGLQLTAQENGEAEAQVMAASMKPLQQAAVVASRVNEEVKRAEDLLATIEQGLDDTELEINRKRELAASLEEAKRQEEERLANEAREAAEFEAREVERKKAEKEAAKAARRAEKAARKAEEAARPVFPVSKHYQEHGARIVSCVGDDEYEWDGDDDEEAAAAASQQPVADPEVADDALEAEASPLTGAAAFDLSAALADSDDPPAAPGIADLGGLDFSKPLIGGSLFDKLKAQLKDTFVSYLCASMPESLLKKYQASELIGCLQFTLKELRRHLALHGLEDISEEEPTSIAEEFRQNNPSNWLDYLQAASPGVLRGKYDVPEVIDTLQALCQTCLERLDDAMGPLTMWAEESSPLRYVAPLEPPQPARELETPTAASADEAPLHGSEPAGGAAWDSSLGAAPWEAQPEPISERHAPAGTLASSGMAATMMDFKQRTYADAAPAHLAATMHQFRSPAPAATPQFDSTLGPAIWDQELPSRPVMPGTSTSRPCGTGAVGSRGGMTATAHRQRPLTYHTGHVR